MSRAEAATFVLPVAERHAEDGIPLPFLFTALHAGIRKLWEIVLESATEGDAETIAVLGMHLADLTGTISVLMTEVYQDSDFALRTTTRHELSALCAGGTHRAFSACGASHTLGALRTGGADRPFSARGTCNALGSLCARGADRAFRARGTCNTLGSLCASGARCAIGASRARLVRQLMTGPCCSPS